MRRLVRNRRALTLGQSAFLAGLAQVAVYLALYLWHAAVSGTFALPPAVLAVLTPLTPLVTALGGWLVHGLATGDWSVPTPLPPDPAPVQPPTPITPPPVIPPPAA